jgi:hypothetical protein
LPTTTTAVVGSHPCPFIYRLIALPRGLHRGDALQAHPS